MVTSATQATGIGSIFQKDTVNSAKTSNDAFAKNSDMYLTLFLTQLKNQDPTQPFDTAQMTQQLAQLNTSQQQIQMNSNLESLISLNKSSQASSLAGFINKKVEYLGDTFFNSGGEADKFSYLVDKDYSSVNIQIANEQGQIVASFEGNKASGTHDFAWDGKDSSGEAVPAGTYKIAVNGKDSSDQFSPLGTFLSGTVTGVDFASSNEPVVFVGSDSNRVGVDLSRISAVLDAPITLANNN